MAAPPLTTRRAARTSVLRSIAELHPKRNAASCACASVFHDQADRTEVSSRQTAAQGPSMKLGRATSAAHAWERRLSKLPAFVQCALRLVYTIRYAMFA